MRDYWNVYEDGNRGSCHFERGGHYGLGNDKLQQIFHYIPIIKRFAERGYSSV